MTSFSLHDYFFRDPMGKSWKYLLPGVYKKSFLTLCQVEITTRQYLNLSDVLTIYNHAVLSQFSHVHICDPMDYNLPGSSVHRIIQARLLVWVARPRRSSGSMYWTCISLFSALVGRFFTVVSSGKPLCYKCYSDYVLQPESWTLSLPWCYSLFLFFLLLDGKT